MKNAFARTGRRSVPVIVAAGGVIAFGLFRISVIGKMGAPSSRARQGRKKKL
jgi:hypothetical protein